MKKFMQLIKVEELLLKAKKQGLTFEEFFYDLKHKAKEEVSVKVISQELNKSVKKIRQITDEELVREKDLSNGDTLCHYKGSDMTKITKELFKMNDLTDMLTDKIEDEETRDNFNDLSKQKSETINV